MSGLAGIVLGAVLYGVFRWKCQYAIALVVTFGIVQTSISIAFGPALGFVITLPVAVLTAFILNGDYLTRPEQDDPEEVAARMAVCKYCGKDFEQQNPAQDCTWCVTSHMNMERGG